MSAHNLPAGSSPCADVQGVCGHLQRAHANVEGDGGGRVDGGVPLFRNAGVAVLTLIAGRGARARARSQTSTSKPTPPLPVLLLLVRSPSNTHKHTAVRAAVWVSVVACGPVLFELPLRLPSVQIHYERSSAPPASTTCDSKSTRSKETCASAHTHNATPLRDGLTSRQELQNNGQRTQHPISAARTSRKSSWASGFSWNPVGVSG